MRVRLRSLLFTPGNVPKMMKKGSTSGADVQILDLEDSVPEGSKDEARGAVREWLLSVPETQPSTLLVPRVNNTVSHLKTDLRAVCAGRAWGVTVPKIESVDQLLEIEALVTEAEVENELRVGSLRLLPWIETALGVVNAAQIAACSSRVVALCFGADDFRADMGLLRENGATNHQQHFIDFARMQTSLAARSARVLALDTPFTNVKDSSELPETIRRSRQIGFKGMFAIHPAHVSAINAGFAPSPQDVQKATRIVQAFVESCENHSRASISLDGQMVDVPVFRASVGLLEQSDDADLNLLARAKKLL